MANWEIPANRASMTYFVQNVETIYNKINAEIKAAAAEMPNLTPGSDEWNVAAFYLTGLDKQQRDNGGFGEIAGQFLAEVDQAASVPELLETTLRFGRNYNLTYLGSFIYEPDFMDSKRKILCLEQTGYWSERNLAGRGHGQPGNCCCLLRYVKKTLGSGRQPGEHCRANRGPGNGDDERYCPGLSEQLRFI